MPSSAGKWTLNMAFHNHKTDKEGEGELEVNVINPTTSVMKSFTANDSTKLFVSLIQPDLPKIGLNNFEISIHKKDSLMGFTAVDDYNVEIVPIMPSMGHGSPNNVNPVFTELGHYTGLVNFTMTGLWNVKIIIKKNGVIISDNGYIVTNNHVISGADKIEVTLNDKRSYVARIIGFDASTDVALIKIEQKGLPFLLYGNSDLVKIGEWVLAVGNPFNLNSTVTAGIISAKGRNNILDNNKRPIESFIQTDAAVNPGNSGGALVNTNGELIGINTAIASNNGTYQGYSFAVPVNIVKKVISDLIEFGSVQRAFIGISIKDIDSKFASDKNINQLNGIYVNGINNGGSAEDAGIKEGDIITKIQDINVGSVSELQEQISRYRPGDKIIIALLRNNKPIEITLTLKNLNNPTSLIKKTESLILNMSSVGAEFTQMKPEDLAKFGFENGIMITKLYSGKLSLVGIKEGFIITSIDKKKILVIEELKRIFDDKKGLILLEGFYTNGVKASYSFNL